MRWLAPDALTLHLWSIRLDERLSLQDEAWMLGQLTHAELQRHLRFQHAGARDAFLRSHTLLHQVLAGYDGIPSTSRSLRVGTYGKPAIATGCNPLGLHFNLSHSGQYALLLVGTASDRIGVDIEQHRPDRPLEPLSSRYFSASESDVIRRCAAQGRDIVGPFFAFWSLKEAFVKAHGRGISLGLDRFSFDLQSDPILPAFSTELVLDPASETWFFRRFSEFPDHSAAIASALPVRHLSWRSLSMMNISNEGLQAPMHITDYQH